MRKLLTFALLAFLSLLAFKNFAFAQPEVNECFDFYTDALYHNKAGYYEKAIQAGELAVKKYPSNPSAHLCLGRSYYRVGKLKLALEHMSKAASLLSDKDIPRPYDIYGEMGEMCERMGYFDDALFYYNKALKLVRDLGYANKQTLYLSRIADVYKAKGKLDKALSYYEEALRLESDKELKDLIYDKIVPIYIDKGDYQKATEYIQKAIETSKEEGDYSGVYMWKLELGDVYRRMKDYKSAEKYILEGLKGVKKSW